MQRLPGPEEQLRRLQCLATVGQIAAGVGHELRNYLIPITAHAQLASELMERSEGDEHLTGIVRAAQRCRELIDQLLLAGRHLSIDRRPLCVGSLVREVQTLLRAAVPRAIEIRTAIAPDIPLVETDPASIEQVVLNLVLNAAKACPAGYGVIEISVQAWHDVRPDAPTDGVRLSVRDDGVGMDPALAERIFDPWFTSWRANGGSGLGLCVVREIVTRHQGEIRVHSAPGVGTVFHVDLPIARKP